MDGIDSDKHFIKIASHLENDRFILEVADSGVGIEKGKQELIFRPGYTTKNSGTGLGLHSVANFIKSV
jgi:signal transduction histidine kinase